MSPKAQALNDAEGTCALMGNFYEDFCAKVNDTYTKIEEATQEQQTLEQTMLALLI